MPGDGPESLPVPSPEIIREFPDRGAQWLFEDPRLVQELLAMAQPELAGSLDFEHAERINRTFIPADLKKKETDLLFRVPVKGTDQEVWIYLLLEHQSTVDALMALRLFLYIGEIWKAQQREWEDKDLSGDQKRLWPVVPLVFYTGEESWPQPISLLDNMTVPRGVEAYIPQWSTLFLSLHDLSEATLAQGATVIGQALRVWKAENRPLADLEQTIREALLALEGLTDIQVGQWLRVVWFFILLAYNRREEPEYAEVYTTVIEDIESSRFKLKSEVERMGKTMAQAVAERAEEKGRRDEVKELLNAELRERFGNIPAEVRAKIESAGLETLRVWLKATFKADTLDEALS